MIFRLIDGFFSSEHWNEIKSIQRDRLERHFIRNKIIK